MVLGNLGKEATKEHPLRVAAYCRVSYEEEKMDAGSFMNQRLFFKKEIEEHPDWVNVGIFGDYHKTGTQIQCRTSFKRMMMKAEAGEIDFIITKSIARFSRSATDTITAIRTLKKKGVGVYFMAENINTLGMDSEVILTILSSVAEMESQNISENMCVVFRSMNEMGTPLRKARFGYRKEGKAWVVIPRQANVVRLIFRMAANGYTFKQIADEVTNETGKKWDSARVKSTLLSEVYIGDILTNQTTVIWDEHGKRNVKNDGIVDAFYIEGHHDPIVGKELYNKMKEMIEKRELAGQANFKSIDELKKLASEDPYLRTIKRKKAARAKAEDFEPTVRW